MDNDTLRIYAAVDFSSLRSVAQALRRTGIDTTTPDLSGDKRKAELIRRLFSSQRAISQSLPPKDESSSNLLSTAQIVKDANARLNARRNSNQSNNSSSRDVTKQQSIQATTRQRRHSVSGPPVEADFIQQEETHHVETSRHQERRHSTIGLPQLAAKELGTPREPERAPRLRVDTKPNGANLTNALISELAKKPFQCAVCTKSFRIQQHLDVHIRSHPRAELEKAVGLKHRPRVLASETLLNSSNEGGNDISPSSFLSDTESVRGKNESYGNERLPSAPVRWVDDIGDISQRGQTARSSKSQLQAQPDTEKSIDADDSSIRGLLDIGEQKEKADSELFALETERDEVASQLTSLRRGTRDMNAKKERALQTRLFLEKDVSLQEAQWFAHRISRELQRVSQSKEEMLSSSVVKVMGPSSVPQINETQPAVLLQDRKLILTALETENKRANEQIRLEISRIKQEEDLHPEYGKSAQEERKRGILFLEREFGRLNIEIEKILGANSRVLSIQASGIVSNDVQNKTERKVPGPPPRPTAPPPFLGVGGEQKNKVFCSSASLLDKPRPPGPADILGRQAQELASNRKDPVLTQKLFKEALEHDPNHSTNIGNYAKFVHETKPSAVDEADELFQRAIRAHSAHPRNLTNYAEFLQETNAQPARIEQYFERAVEADAGSASVLVKYGIYHEGNGDISRAKLLYERALKVDPSHIQGVHRLVNLLSSPLPNGEIFEAEQVFIRALQQSPSNPDFLCGLADMLLQQYNNINKSSLHKLSPEKNGVNPNSYNVSVEEKRGDNGYIKQRLNNGHFGQHNGNKTIETQRESFNYHRNATNIANSYIEKRKSNGYIDQHDSNGYIDQHNSKGYIDQRYGGIRRNGSVNGSGLIESQQQSVVHSRELLERVRELYLAAMRVDPNHARTRQRYAVFLRDFQQLRNPIFQHMLASSPSKVTEARRRLSRRNLMHALPPPPTYQLR